ncbi:MAG TPA: hypothetical protein VK277_06070 [Acidimicrobiales bacterium]|nr:hypothetical protein [Acidimicrobiales bacterium]
MSRQGVEEAVEQLWVDEPLARAVAADGVEALGSFDLTDDEKAGLVTALRLDIQESLGDVSGFALDAMAVGTVNLGNVTTFGRTFGGPNLGTAGHEKWIEFTSPGTNEF